MDKERECNSTDHQPIKNLLTMVHPIDPTKQQKIHMDYLMNTNVSTLTHIFDGAS